MTYFHYGYSIGSQNINISRIFIYLHHTSYSLNQLKANVFFFTSLSDKHLLDISLDDRGYHYLFYFKVGYKQNPLNGQTSHFGLAPHMLYLSSAENDHINISTTPGALPKSIPSTTNPFKYLMEKFLRLSCRSFLFNGSFLPEVLHA